MDWSTLAVLAAATFAGALVQAASGFGFAIVAAPVFLAATGATWSISLLVALHVVQSAMLAPAVWREAPPVALRRLLAGAVLGCPVGLALFLWADVRTLKIAVGVLILAVTALILARERGLAGAPARGSGATERDGGAAVVTGAFSGAMTSLLVMPGPPLMVWLMGTSLGKAPSRALSLTFFAVCYVAVTLLNAAAGQLPPRVWGMVALLAPAVVVGTLAGSRIVRHISETAFRRVVLTLLVLSGLGAIWSALR